MSDQSEPSGGEPPPRTPMAWLGQDFGVRLASAIAMAAIAAGALIAGRHPFDLLVFVLANPRM